MTADTSAPATPARRLVHPALILVVICGAQLMVVLDATIVNIALPSIQKALGFSEVDLAWVLNAYTLTFGGLLLLGGRMGDLYGQRRMFTIGVALFALASGLGGFAQTQGWLLAMRALQGVGGAIASPAGLALIATSFPAGPSRNKAVGLYAAVSGSGAAIGLLLGGLLTHFFSWRWVLFVNVPIGVALAVAAPIVLGEAERRHGRLDLPGALTSTFGVGAIVYGLIYAAQHAADRGFTKPVTLVSLLVGVVLLAAFVVIERRHDQPLVPLHLFSDSTRSGSYLVAVAVAASLFAMFFFLTLFVQEVLGYNPLRAGLAFLPISAGIILVAGLSAQLVRRIPAGVIMATGMGLATVALLWLSRITPTSTFLGGVLGPSLVLAAGMGLVFVPLTLTAVHRVPNDESGSASALLNTAQQVGGTLGLAILLSVSAEATTRYIAHRVPTVGSGQPTDQASLQMTAVAGQVHGWSVAFLAGAAIAFVGLVVALLMIKVRPADLNASHGPAVI